jgi:hypothetical protein
MFDTNFLWPKNELGLWLRHSNFTAKFTIKEEVVEVFCRMEVIPYGSLYDTDETNDLPTHVICDSPKTTNTGSCTI